MSIEKLNFDFTYWKDITIVFDTIELLEWLDTKYMKEQAIKHIKEIGMTEDERQDVEVTCCNVEITQEIKDNGGFYLEKYLRIIPFYDRQEDAERSQQSAVQKRATEAVEEGSENQNQEAVSAPSRPATRPAALITTPHLGAV